MGVAGAGKTAVGRVLATRMGFEFADADDYHSSASVAKMRSGVPLTDEDRAPWLESLRALLAKWVERGQNGVLGCSALKESYRQRLLIAPEVRLVYLKASRPVLAERLHARRDHYMRESMLDSQLAALEEPAEAIVVDADAPVETIVAEIQTALAR